MDGGFGDDTLNGEQGNDELYGRDGNDILDGGEGNDKVYGGAGDDLIFAGDGDDFYDGGDGVDTIDLTRVDQDYTLDLSTGNLTRTNGSIEKVLNFENISAGDGAQTLAGTSTANNIDGGAGSDVINGGAGSDTLTGGTGDDVFVFSSGDGQDVIADFLPPRDSIQVNGEVLDPNALPSGVTAADQGSDVLISYGSGDTILLVNTSLAEWVSVLNNSGDDTFTGTSANETFYAGAGNDTINAGAGNDDLHGGSGDDDLRGSSGNDRYFINHDDGADIILDQSGTNDRIVFGAGITEDMLEFSISDAEGNGLNNLVISVSGTSQTITLKDAFDTNVLLVQTVDYIDFADGSSTSLAALYASKYFVGTDGNDRYLGTTLNDTMHGLAGNDFLFGSNGNDALYGGVGNDDVFGGNGNDVHYGGDGNDFLYGWYGDDELHGGAGDDRLEGGVGQDRYYINLGEGADTIFDKDGNDRLYFGEGITRDLLEFSVSDADGNGKGNLVISFDGLTQSVTIRDAFDDIGLLAPTIDSVYFANGSGTSLAELYSTGYFVGTAGNDRYIGTGLSESMHGQGGDDFIFGSSGNDTIYGGVGNDELRGGDGNDVHFGGDGDDLIAAYNGNDELRGDGGNDTLYGEAGNDQLYGGADNDRIDGGGGDDNHYGEDGDDYILGNVGADFFDGGDGNDTIDFSYSSNNFSLNLTLSNAVFASGFTEQVVNFENIVGGSGNNTLTGSNVANSISGGAGNDRIIGLSGDDTLTGDAGADVFVFNTLVAEGADTVTDFQLNTDKIELAGTTYAALNLVDTMDGTRVEWANGSVELEDIALATLTEDQFLFV